MLLALPSMGESQSALHDSVPYQEDPLLSHPIPFEATAGGEVYFDCNWNRLLAMIQDLETRISVALETEVPRVDYAISQQSNERFFRAYDCYVLRDSVLSLQIQLDEALASEPGVESRGVEQVAQTLATLKGAVLDDGNVDLQVWGFLWGPDSTSLDSITVPLNPGFVTSEMDTGSFSYALTDLTRYTDYYYKAFASNEEGPGYGELLSFKTLADRASNISLDTADVTQNSARIVMMIGDNGGQNPESAGFYFDASNFTLDSFVGDSIASDSTSGLNHSAVLTGLSRYTDYYFIGYADNSAGRGHAASTFSFKTLPDLIQLGTVNWSNHSLSAAIASTGGQSPTSQGLIYGASADLSTVETKSASLLGTTVTAPEDSLPAGTSGYAALFATNNAGTSYSDTIALTTRVGVFTDTLVTESSATSKVVRAQFDFSNAAPSAVGFKWGTLPDLSTAQDSLLTLTADSIRMEIDGISNGDTIYYVAYAVNSAGTSFGDTASFSSAEPCISLDYQNVTYALTEIDGTCWFAENLRASLYQNGDAIQDGTHPDFDWASNFDQRGAQIITTASSHYAWTELGRYYNAYAVEDARGICPAGWSIPSTEDWDAIKSYADDLVAIGSPSNGTDSKGFSLKFNGIYISGNVDYSSSFGYLNSEGLFWLSDAGSDITGAYHYIGGSLSWSLNSYAYSWNGTAIRCIRD